MKDISNSVDDKLKIYASSQKVNIPDSYNLMVENCVDRCLKENVPAKYKIHKTVAVAVVAAIVAGWDRRCICMQKIIFLT